MARAEPVARTSCLQERKSRLSAACSFFPNGRFGKKAQRCLFPLGRSSLFFSWIQKGNSDGGERRLASRPAGFRAKRRNGEHLFSAAALNAPCQPETGAAVCLHGRARTGRHPGRARQARELRRLHGRRRPSPRSRPGDPGLGERAERIAEVFIAQFTENLFLLGSRQ